jgi:hypothetical protein
MMSRLLITFVLGTLCIAGSFNVFPRFPRILLRATHPFTNSGARRRHATMQSDDDIFPSALLQVLRERLIIAKKDYDSSPIGKHL